MQSQNLVGRKTTESEKDSFSRSFEEKKRLPLALSLLYSPDELAVLFESVGRSSTVIDKNDAPRCNIMILEVFETKFGSPDLKLVAGEGYGDNFKAFQDSHRKAWQDLVQPGELDLNDETVLVVEVFKLLQE